MKTRIRKGIYTAAAGLLLMAHAWPVAALTEIPTSWQNRIIHADRMGVLECVIAGLSAAEFKVVDNWFGLEEGERVRVSIGSISDALLDSQPAELLVGDHVLAIGHRRKAPEREGAVMDRIGFRPNPLAGRPRLADISAWALELPLSTVEDLAPASLEDMKEFEIPFQPLREFGSPHPNLAQFKRDVTRFKGLPSERQEFESMYSFIELHKRIRDFEIKVFRKQEAQADQQVSNRGVGRKEPEPNALPGWRVSRGKSLERLVRWTLDNADKNSHANLPPLYVFTYGGEQLLDILKGLPPRARFEDEAKGVEALKQCAEIPGDAGAWAAITLVRRGHGEYMRRALKVYDLHENEARARAWEHVQYAGPRAFLASHLNTILSNMAAAANVEPPEGGFPRQTRGAYSIPEDQRHPSRRLLKWWVENESKMVAGDPWLEELSRLKVD